MYFTLKHIIPKVHNLIISGFVSGFCVGCFPNKLDINFEGKKYNSLNIPLISGVICSTGIMLSPLLMINYFCDSTYFDRLVDKYDINVERYHQYDGKNNKYAYPSMLIINIKSNKH
jgi:hypothetical protein